MTQSDAMNVGDEVYVAFDMGHGKFTYFKGVVRQSVPRGWKVYYPEDGMICTHSFDETSQTTVIWKCGKVSATYRYRRVPPRGWDRKTKQQHVEEDEKKNVEPRPRNKRKEKSVTKKQVKKKMKSVRTKISIKKVKNVKRELKTVDPRTRNKRKKKSVAKEQVKKKMKSVRTKISNKKVKNVRKKKLCLAKKMLDEPVAWPVIVGSRIEVFFESEGEWERGTVIAVRKSTIGGTDTPIVDVMYDFGACENDIDVERGVRASMIKTLDEVVHNSDLQKYRAHARKARASCDIIGWDHKLGSLGDTSTCVDISNGQELSSTATDEDAQGALRRRVPVLGTSSSLSSSSKRANLPCTFTYVRIPVTRVGMSDEEIFRESIIAGEEMSSSLQIIMGHRRCDCRSCFYCKDYDQKYGRRGVSVAKKSNDRVNDNDGDDAATEMEAKVETTDRKYGCSKCRWRLNGCGRCKKKNFKHGPMEWLRRSLMTSGQANYEVLKQMWDVESGMGGIRSPVAISSKTPICRALARAGLAHGFGLVAAAPIGEGRPVIEYVGEILTQSQAKKREAFYAEKTNAFSESAELEKNRRRRLRDPRPRAYESGRCYQLHVSSLVLDATIYGNAARFINHSCEPNCAARRMKHSYSLPRIMIYALRPIAEGEEITWSYNGYGTSDSGCDGESDVGGLDLSECKCYCGAASCLGRL